MIKFDLRVPITHVLNARSLVTLNLQTFDAYAEMREKIVIPDRAIHGDYAASKAEAQRADIALQQTETCNDIVKALRELHEQYNAEVDAQIALDGSALVEADYQLIKDGLISTPEQLRAVIHAHSDSYTILSACDHYGTGKGWDGFALVTNSEVLREFGDNWFSMAERGAADPLGYASMQIMAAGELARMLTAYGLEYAIPEGEKPEDPEEPTGDDLT